MKRFDAAEWRVGPVNAKHARFIIESLHYAKGASTTGVYIHGLFRDDVCYGVAWWMPPTKNTAITVNPDHWRRVLTLSRLAIHPDVPTNGASFLLGRSIRLIKQDGVWRSLVTYADTSQGHTGAIYKATNWQYVGMTKEIPRWVDADGKQVSKLSTKSRTTAQMLALGYVHDGNHAKHKFVIHLPAAHVPGIFSR